MVVVRLRREDGSLSKIDISVEHLLLSFMDCKSVAWTSCAVDSLSPLPGCREDNKHRTNVAHTPAISVLSTQYQLKITGQHFNNALHVISTEYVAFRHRHICSGMPYSEEHISERPKLSNNYNKGPEVKMLAYYYFSLISSCKMGVIFSCDIL